VPVLIDGTPGVVIIADDQPVTIMAFSVVDDRIVAIDSLADRDRVAGLDLSGVDLGA
jgi:RNA polymerase sigma-70 factor (ECF subfamily)